MRKLEDIKKELDCNVGKKLTLKANGGRRKTIERSGVLSNTYPSIFVIELDEQYCTTERLSFSYADILTETVELTFSDSEINLGS